MVVCRGRHRMVVEYHLSMHYIITIHVCAEVSTINLYVLKFDSNLRRLFCLLWIHKK